MRGTPAILFSIFFFVFALMAGHLLFREGWYVFAGGFDAIGFWFAMIAGRAILANA